MKVLIVDDEAPARTRLRGLLEELSITPVGEAGNGREALKLAQEGGADVVLLDIRMPGMDGLEAARHLNRLEPAPAVIFTTAYGEHALEAFDAEAVDYLLKPVRRERLAQALERARRLTAAQLESLTAQGGRTHLTTRQGGRVELVPLEAVLFFRAEDKYVTAYHREGEALLEQSLKALEDEFGERLVRLHRSVLVPRERIAGLEKGADGEVGVRVAGWPQALEVSRRHLPELRRLIKAGRLAGE